MSKFFQKVATPDTQSQQSAAPSGPTVDVNARAEAQNEYDSNLGSAIMDLIGTTGAVMGAVEKYDEAELARMRSENQLDADADTADLGSFMSTFIDSKSPDKKISDYEPEELRVAVDEAASEFIKSKKLSDKGYFALIKEDIKNKGGLFFNRQTELNQKKQQDKRYDSMMSSVKGLFSASKDPAEIVSELKSKLEQNVGLDFKTIVVDGKEVTINPAIKDTEENAKLPAKKDVATSNNVILLA